MRWFTSWWFTWRAWDKVGGEMVEDGTTSVQAKVVHKMRVSMVYGMHHAGWTLGVSRQQSWIAGMLRGKCCKIFDGWSLAQLDQLDS